MNKMKLALLKKIRAIRNSSDPPISKTQLYAASIFRLFLKEDGADLLLLPVQKQRIIKLADKGTFAVLEASKITITNHKYSYSIEIAYSLCEKLQKMFDRKLDENRYDQEKDLINQMENGLLNLLNEYKHK
jgi:hypothetical protein